MVTNGIRKFLAVLTSAYNHKKCSMESGRTECNNVASNRYILLIFFLQGFLLVVSWLKNSFLIYFI